ncbi:MAG: hypothetical protein M3Z08_09230 [Chloroflexota bacterium]|nr:hypothetical protein [Chloroflexota bacterium]
MRQAEAGETWYIGPVSAKEGSKKMAAMVRQCAWCLRLTNHLGEQLSATPMPKLYEATHGMCQVCGVLWLEQTLGAGADSMSLLESLRTPTRVRERSPAYLEEEIPLF